MEQACGILQQVLPKVSSSSIVGRIQTRTWDDTEGKRHYVTEVIADEAFFADSKKSDEVSSKPSFGEGSTGEDGFYPIADDDELPF